MWERWERWLKLSEREKQKWIILSRQHYSKRWLRYGSHALVKSNAPCMNEFFLTFRMRDDVLINRFAGQLNLLSFSMSLRIGRRKCVTLKWISWNDKGIISCQSLWIISNCHYRWSLHLKIDKWAIPLLTLISMHNHFWFQILQRFDVSTEVFLPRWMSRSRDEWFTLQYVGTTVAKRESLVPRVLSNGNNANASKSDAGWLFGKRAGLSYQRQFRNGCLSYTKWVWGVQ